MGKELADRESASLKQQLSTQWSSWHPVWVQRLHTWRERVLSLSKAQQDEQRLMEAVARGWDGLRSERALRYEVLQAVQQLQGRLSALAAELNAIDDRNLSILDS